MNKKLNKNGSDDEMYAYVLFFSVLLTTCMNNFIAIMFEKTNKLTITVSIKCVRLE